jgi:hypothetical protein
LGGDAVSMWVPRTLVALGVSGSKSTFIKIDVYKNRRL